MIIKTIDLIKIANAGKSFKQKDFLVYSNRLYGMDNIKNYLTYTSVIPLESLPLNIALKINYKELSNFINTIIAEEFFSIDANGNCYNACGSILHIDTHIMWTNLIKDKLMSRIYIAKKEYGIINDDLNDNLLLMKKADGVYYYKKDNYFMTLFPGILPVNKGDKIELILYDINFNTFISEFIIHKKKIDIVVNLAYLKVY